MSPPLQADSLPSEPLFKTVMKKLIVFLLLILFSYVDHFESFYWICYNTVLWFSFLAALPDQGSNPDLLHLKLKCQPLDCQGSPKKLIFLTITFLSQLIQILLKNKTMSHLAELCLTTEVGTPKGKFKYGQHCGRKQWTPFPGGTLFFYDFFNCLGERLFWLLICPSNFADTAHFFG